MAYGLTLPGWAHLFGGEEQLGRDVIRRLKCAGYRARVGIADTLAAAFALARFARGEPAAQVFSKRFTSQPKKPGLETVKTEPHVAIAPAGATASSLSLLPVEALRLEAQTVVLLRRLGLRCIGQLYDIPRQVLARRFRELKTKKTGKDHRVAGTSGARAELAQAVVMRLDQVLGRLSDPRRPLSEPPVFMARQAYPELLITAEGIETACQDLAKTLCADLAAVGKGARRLRFSLYRADGSIADALIGTAQPCRTPRHMCELFRDKLAKLDAGFGVDMIALEALEVETMGEAQSQLATSGVMDAETMRLQQSALIDRLANRLGRDTVFRLEAAESYIPERAQRRTAQFANTLSHCASSAPSHRPPFLFSPPELISVIAEVPEGAPARFIWRRAVHRIVKAEGPERIAAEWWQWLADSAARGDEEGLAIRARIRDYYCLEDECGAAYWVFRAGLYQREIEDGAPAWYVHGLFG